ncbi:hypothetical protein HanPSC8_Chr08g0317521 [Helianthus annuus]|nr:hypothetical protein HanPSC8_Chr08g0317521 [Helianthus annuus]
MCAAQPTLAHASLPRYLLATSPALHAGTQPCHLFAGSLRIPATSWPYYSLNGPPLC